MVKRGKDSLIKAYEGKKALEIAKNGFSVPCFVVREPRTDIKILLKMFEN
jgi:hypothetical protein